MRSQKYQLILKKVGKEEKDIKEQIEQIESLQEDGRHKPGQYSELHPM